MISSCQLTIGSLEGVVFCIDRYTENGVVVVRCVHICHNCAFIMKQSVYVRVRCVVPSGVTPTYTTLQPCDMVATSHHAPAVLCESGALAADRLRVLLRGNPGHQRARHQGDR